ncbi:MAG: hypothetical protein V3576_04270 [Candidatus Cloacimonadota bacterium]
MKKSFKQRYHMLIIILFSIIVLEAILLLVSLNSARNLASLVTDMQSIIIIFVFAIFVYLIVMYNYIPFRMHKALKEVREKIDEISQGNYYLDFDASLYDQDRDIQELIHALQKMLSIIIRFDTAKADKIFEHHQRISQLLSMMKQSILITSINGDVIYCNEVFRKSYPSISEMSNLNELIFKEEFNRNLFDTILAALRYGNNLSEIIIRDPAGSRAVQIEGTIIRNRKGVGTGAVFVLDKVIEQTKDQSNLR